MTNKKAITSLLAVLILGTMTVSASGAAFYWINLIQGQVASQEGIKFEKLGTLESDIDILTANYNSGNDKLTLYLKNIGTASVPLESEAKVPTTLWLVMDPQNNIICSTDWSGANKGPTCLEGCKENIKPDETRKVVLTNMKEGMLCNLATLPSDSLLSFSVDFSGKAIATGNFIS